MLPPIENVIITFSPFNPANSDIFHLIISGLSRKYTFTTQKEKIQDISEKQVEIPTPK